MAIISKFNKTHFKGMPDVKPMVIGIWCGVGKPKSLNDFLRPLVNDINAIIAHGAIINDHRLDIEIRCFICDSPARSFLKGIFNISPQMKCNFSMNISCEKNNLNALRYSNQWNTFQKNLFLKLNLSFN